MSENNVRVKKSVTRNAVLNVVKTIMSLAFPLITFPYSTRVLGLTAVGKYNFASSVVSYFTMLAALGITMYAVREGSKYRDDPEKTNQFCNEVFSINIYSMVFTLFLLYLSILFVGKLQGYTILLLIFSVRIVLNTINVNWIYSIFEDFSFPTITAALMEVISISVMLLFVHSPADLYIYAVSAVIAYNGYGLLTFLYARKYVNLKFVWKPSMIHLKPIMIIFFLELGMSVYVDSDIILVGWIDGDDATGLYSTASTIYKILKQVLNALNMVVLPRIAYHVGREAICIHDNDRAGYEENHAQAEKLGSLLVNTTITLALPMMVGIYLIAEPIVILFAGEAFHDAYQPLQLLSIALLFAVLAVFYGQSVLTAYKQEKVYMKATILSAVVNIVLNLILIPKYHVNAAACTTILAELIMVVITYRESRKYLKIPISKNVIVSSVVGCAAIVGVSMILKRLIASSMIYMFATIAVSVAVYGAIMILFRNDVIWRLLGKQSD
ncbi:MAG: flippase [Solobacterium sp.]|nr:flippase [Solobacterium sp.]